MRPTTLLALPLLAPLLCAGQGAGDWVRVDLEDRLLALHAVELPQPPWRTVGDVIDLGQGRRFAARETAGDRLSLDLDGDGDPDRSFRAREGVARLRLGDSAEGGPASYPVRLRRSPLDQAWEWAPAGCVRGRLGGTTLCVYDLDGDARYDGYASDAMVLGTDPVACLLSAIVPVDGELVELIVSPDGEFAGARPWEGASGWVDLRSGFRSRGQLDSAILRSGELAFEVGRARAAVRLPVGSYELAHARAGAGATRVRIESGELGRIAVAEGRTTSLEWGAPVLATCDAFFEAGRLHVLPFTTRARGSAGERYVDFSPRRGVPALAVRLAGRGGALGEVEYLPDGRGEWGAFVLPVPRGAQVEVDLRLSLPLFGTTSVRVLETDAWSRRSLGLR